MRERREASLTLLLSCFLSSHKTRALRVTEHGSWTGNGRRSRGGEFDLAPLFATRWSAFRRPRDFLRGLDTTTTTRQRGRRGRRAFFYFYFSRQFVSGMLPPIWPRETGETITERVRTRVGSEREVSSGDELRQSFKRGGF